MHNYVNHFNMAWAKTVKTKFCPILSKYKHSIRITYHQHKNKLIQNHL